MAIWAAIFQMFSYYFPIAFHGKVIKGQKEVDANWPSNLHPPLFTYRLHVHGTIPLFHQTLRFLLKSSVARTSSPRFPPNQSRIRTSLERNFCSRTTFSSPCSFFLPLLTKYEIVPCESKPYETLWWKRQLFIFSIFVHSVLFVELILLYISRFVNMFF